MGSFRLHGNAITGTLPTEIGPWNRLGKFSVPENALSGTIPTEIVRWREMERFTVQRELNPRDVADRERSRRRLARIGQ